MNEPNYSTLAKLDLENIRDYIGQTLQNPDAAHRVCVAIARRAHLLAAFPHSGTPCRIAEHPDIEYRRASAQHYVIIYHAEGNVVHIDRVLHESSAYLDAPLA